MDYIKRFLFNLLLLGFFGTVIYFAFPGVMRLVFQTLDGLLGPVILTLLVIGIALPVKRKKKPVQRLNQKTGNLAGVSTEKMVKDRSYKMLAYGLIGFCMIVLVAVMISNSKAFGIGSLGVVILLVLLKVLPDLLLSRLDVKQKEVDRASRGAESEVVVDNLFFSLPEQYFVINDVVSQYGNIDHILIKQNGGVFLIETKSHHGTISFQGASILLNGHPTEKDFIRQTLNNAYWLRDEINKVIGKNVWIFPIIVFTNAFVPFSQPIKGIHVVNKRFLTSTLEKVVNNNPLNQQIWEARDKIMQQLKNEVD